MRSFREIIIGFLNEHEDNVLRHESNGECEFDRCETCDERGYCDNLRHLLEMAAKA